MPKLSLEVSHQLGLGEAVQRIKRQFDEVRANKAIPVSDLVGEWKDDVLSFGFQAMGMKIAGTVAVEDKAVQVDAELPWAAAMLKGVIEQRVRQELGQVLA